MDNNFAEFLTTGAWNTPTHFLERRLILSVVKGLCTCYTHSLHLHCTHKVENAKGKGCTYTHCTRGSGIPGCYKMNACHDKLVCSPRNWPIFASLQN
jgi:hypothetical protein